MSDKQVNAPSREGIPAVPTIEGGSIRVYFDADSDCVYLEVWDPYSDLSSEGWVTLSLTPQAASALKAAL